MPRKARRTQPQRPSPRVAEEIRDRKAGLHIGRWTLHWTAVAALAAIAALLVAVAGPIKDWWMPQEPPGTIFVIKPSAVVAPIFATPVMTEYPVTFVKAGSQFRLDCVKSVDNYKYNFGHISEGIHQNRWLDINDLVLPNGDPPFRALAELPELDICK